MYKDTICLLLVFFVGLHIWNKHKEAVKTGEPLSSLVGGRFCLWTIIVLILSFLQISS